VEAASSFGWHRYLGDGGKMISIERFGVSSPGGVAMEKFGYTVDNVVAQAKSLLG
jgi:transketolase